MLSIDDISSQFSSLDQSVSTTSKIVDIIPTKKFNRYLVQISSKDYTKSQFNEIVILNNSNDIATLEKGSIYTGNSSEIGYTSNLLGDVYGYKNENGDYYLKFEPYDSVSTTYNIKYLNNTFDNQVQGIGTTSIGFVNLIGNTISVASSQTKTIISSPISTLKSIHSQICLTDSTSGDMNYVEIFVDHDGTNTNIAEFYFDIDSELSSGFIGSFGASISGEIISLNYTNDTNNTIVLQSKNVGFGSTSIGVGTNYFKQTGQLDDYANTVKYESKYVNVSTSSTISSFDTSKYTSIKSTIRVGVGQTSALHQVMLISDNSNTYTTQYPFLSIGSTSGIGTFGGELNGTIASLKFYPEPSISGQFEILSFNEVFYKENDYVNIPQYCHIVMFQKQLEFQDIMH